MTTRAAVITVHPEGAEFCGNLLSIFKIHKEIIMFLENSRGQQGH